MAAALDQTAIAVETALGALATSNPAWMGLAATAIEGGPDGQGAVLVFSTRGRKRLFADCLLSRFAVSEEDLAGIDVRLSTLKELASVNVDDNEIGVHGRVLLTSSLSPQDAGRLTALLQYAEVDVLVYGHQVDPLRRRLVTWAELCSADSLNSVLAGLTQDGAVVDWPARLVLDAPSALHVASGLREAGLSALPSFDDLEVDDELFSLLSDPDSGGISELADSSLDVDELDPLCATAIGVEFTDGWHAMYPPEHVLLYVERTGLATETTDRRADALAVGDEVVVIHGQRRQDLYGLLVERLHRNPAVELHLALVERWQSDLESHYAVWRQTSGAGVGELLRLMQERGSSLTSSLTIRFWINRTTIAPNDPEDIRRMAEILEMGFVSRQYRRISAAASRLRGLHRGLAHRLNNWLASNAPAHGSDEVIDAELNLTFDDFRNSLLHLRVVSVTDVRGPLLRSRLGFIARETE